MSQSDFFYSKLLFHFSMDATDSQESLFRALSDFAVQMEECDILVVNGYAGTGKTSALSSFVKH